MIDIMPDDKEISKALNVLNSISDTLRYEKICEISEAQKNTYKELLEKFKQLHDISLTDNAPKNLHNLKGEALENLVSYLLTISGNIFNVDRNLRTSTNEIDQIVTLRSGMYRHLRKQSNLWMMIYSCFVCTWHLPAH